MRSTLLALLLCGTAGCTIQSGVQSTPTFTRAQQMTVLPAVPKKATAKPAATSSTSAFVSPTPGSMRGGTWVIPDFDQDRIYRLPLQTQRVTTILLRDGEKLNGIVGGNYEGFVVSNSYVGSRPAISIMPSWSGVASNLHLATTNAIYSLYAYTARNNINLVDFEQAADGAGDANGVASGSPKPQGDYGVLGFAAPDGKALPAWAPVEVWADSYKLVIRFAGPLPVLPALFAGQEGEQMVSYRVVDDHGNPTMITDRRITEAQLRLDQEVITITAKAPEADSNPHGWRQAATLPAPAPNVAVFVMPGAPDSQTFQASAPSRGGI